MTEIESGFSLLSAFSTNEFEELKQIYVQQQEGGDLSLLAERRKRFHNFVIHSDIDEGVNIRRDFIVDQLFLALEFSFQQSFSFDTTSALLELLNDEFNALLNAPTIPSSTKRSSSASDFFQELMSAEKAKALFQQFQEKVSHRQFKCSTSLTISSFFLFQSMMMK